MGDDTIYLKVIRSYSDESIYNLHLALPSDFQIEALHIQVQQGQFLVRDKVMGWIMNPEQLKFKFSMPLSGTILEIKPNIDIQKAKGKSTLLFVIRICQHQPKLNKQPPKQGKANPLLKTRMRCRICHEEIWYYYNEHQKEITYYEFQSKFDDFSLQGAEWKVILNQTFNKHTQIATIEDEGFYLDVGGKITYMDSFEKMIKERDIDPDRVILKYREIVCNHQKIVNGMCQFCLANDLKQDDLKLYLFQMDLQTINHDAIVRGRLLSDQQKMFKKSLIERQKTLLVLDLDNTILHSIQYWKVDEDLLGSIDEYVIIPLEELNISVMKTVMKLRPFLKEFLEAIIPHYEVFVYTKGTRLYAEMVCLAIRERFKGILEGTKNFLSSRIISRDEDPELAKKNLTFILPTMKDFLVILDDRRDVWNNSPYCIYTKPYHYFYSILMKNSGKEYEIREVDWDKGGGSLGVIEDNKSAHDKMQDDIEKMEQKMLKKQEEGPETKKKQPKPTIQEEERKPLQSLGEYLQVIEEVEGSKIEESGIQASGIERPDNKASGIEESRIEGSEIEGSDIERPGIEGPRIEASGIERPDSEGSEMKGSKIEGSEIEGSDIERSGIEGSETKGKQQQQSAVEESPPSSQQQKQQPPQNKPDKQQHQPIQANPNQHPTTNNSQPPIKISFSSEKDYYLLFAACTMKKLHKSYFQSINLESSSKNRTGSHSDMAHIYRNYRKSLLSHISAKLIVNAPNIEKRAIALGIKIIPRNSEDIPNIIIRANSIPLKIPNNDKRTNQTENIALIKSVKHYSQTLGIPFISESWVSLCYEYSFAFPYDNYIFDDPLQNIEANNKKYAVLKATATISQNLGIIKEELNKTIMEPQ